MAKKIKQFYFKADGDSNNHPNTTNANQAGYVSGQIFSENNVFPITQLGIQALPGTEFYLNGNVNPIVIGVSGIYDLDIKNGARVTALNFGKDSMERINNSSSGYLIVDILYGEED